MTTVTQADREAAAGIVGPKSNKGKYPGFACDYREGRCDTSNLVQAFAAHREAAFEAGAKAMQEAARGLAKTAWISADYNVVGIADADMAMRLCEHAEATIAALDPAQIAGGGK